MTPTATTSATAAETIFLMHRMIGSSKRLNGAKLTVNGSAWVMLNALAVQ